LATLSKEILQNLTELFFKAFNFKCPIVKGSLEASELLKKERFGKFDWTRSIEGSGDMTDMYSNANKIIVKEAYKFAFRYTKLDITEQEFILLLIEIVMDYNVFHEPLGIFKLTGGFAMGCHSSAIGTDILLLVSEIKMFETLRVNNLLKVVKRYIRFRDDVNFRLTGSNKEIKSTLQVILVGYPKQIDYNIQIFFLKNEFLDFRMLTIPNKNTLILSVNRKKQSKYDVVRSNSSTNPKYIGQIVNTAAYTVTRNTNTNYNKQQEIKAFLTILKKTGIH